jgi:hypothetical protein
MAELHNFLASWQLFPEKGTYHAGQRPKSAIYRIEMLGDILSISMNWVSLEDHSFSSQYKIIPNGELQPLANNALADSVKVSFHSNIHFEAQFLKGNQLVLAVHHEITPKGWLLVSQHYYRGEEIVVDTEIYHKQMSVLPYASSLGGVAIRKSEEGIIRHQALSAMEDQTVMQLNQIRQQIELLATQAKEIQKRKELSYMIYESKLSFAPVIGHTYNLYENEDGTFLISMIGPNEWGRKGCPYTFINTVKMLADHTWVEIK